MDIIFYVSIFFSFAGKFRFNQLTLRHKFKEPLVEGKVCNIWEEKVFSFD